MACQSLPGGEHGLSGSAIVVSFERQRSALLKELARCCHRFAVAAAYTYMYFSSVLSLHPPPTSSSSRSYFTCFACFNFVVPVRRMGNNVVTKWFAPLIVYFAIRSLEEFDAAVSVHGKTLEEDLLIKHHLGILYDQLLESNLLKIIQV